MDPALVVRLRPAGPWRIGPSSGQRDRVDRVLHSDTLFSAVCHAMDRLGQLREWLDATAGNPAEPAVRFSSCFPFLQDLDFITPPRHLWPPPPSAKVRWQGARFVPVSLVRNLLAEKPLDENRWTVDGASECLLPLDGKTRPAGPFRTAVRYQAAVDRLSGNTEAHRTACLEFAEGAGLWAIVSFAGEEARGRWAEAVKGAFRVLADTGFGGERSAGWGRAEQPEFAESAMPNLVYAKPAHSEPAAEGEAPRAPETGYWLLSMFSPSADDPVDWQRGIYALANRSGRIESSARWGETKKTLRMVEEGSVVIAGAPPRGRAADVAPDGFPHPIFRSGFAMAVPIPFRIPERPVLTP